jgi:hypothetical protein
VEAELGARHDDDLVKLLAEARHESAKITRLAERFDARRADWREDRIPDYVSELVASAQTAAAALIAVASSTLPQ